MAGSVDLFLNISNGLDENLKKSEKSLSGMNDVASKVNKNMTEMNKSSNMLNDNYDDIVEASEKAAKNTDKMASALSKGIGFAKKLTGLLIGGFTIFQFADVVNDAIRLNQAMSDLSYRMGEAGESAKQLEGAVTGVMIATGASSERAEEWIIGLREMRVATKDLKDLTTSGIQFSEVTGASDDNVRNLIGSLNTMGGMGTKAIKGILGEIVAVQRAFGLSRGEVDALTESTVKTTQMLRQMGKSAAEVASFSKGVTKLAGAFSSVGISAQTATKFVEDLLDPGQIEDNAFLYAKLGISMQDAIEGNVDPSKLVNGFKDLGAELKNMSGPAASAMAKSLGMPLNELRQMAEMDMGELEKTFAGMTGASGELSEEQQEQAKFQKNFQNMMEKTKGVFMELALKVMPLLNKGMSWVADNLTGWIDKGKAFIKSFSLKGAGGIKGLAIVAGLVAAFLLITRFKKKFASVNTEVGKGLNKALSSGMNEAMDMGSKKAASKFEERMKASTNNYMQDLQQRILEGTDYAATQAASNFYKTMGGTRLTKGAAALANHAGEYLDKISAGAKPVSLIDKFLQKSNEKMQHRIKLEHENFMIKKGAYEKVKDEADANNKAYKDRIEQLQRMGKFEDLAPARQEEYNKLIKVSEALDKKSLKAKTELNNLSAKAQLREVSFLKNIAIDERKRMADAIEAEIIRGNEERNRIEVDQKGNQLSIDALSQSKAALSSELLLMDEKIKKEGLSGTALIEANSRRLELVSQQKITNELLIEETQRKDQLAIQDKAAVDALEKNNNQLLNVINANGNITKQQKDILEINKEKLQAEMDSVGISKEKKDLLRAEISELEKLQKGALAGADSDIVFKSFGEKIKGTFMAATNNMVGGLKDGLNVVSDSLKTSFKSGLAIINPKNWRKAIAASGDGSFFKGLGRAFSKGAKTIGAGVSKAGRGMGKAFGKLGGGLKSMGGPLLLLAGLFIGLMKDTKEFKEIMAKIKEVVGDLMKKIMPLISNLMASLMPMIDSLMKSLMPVIEYLADILIKDIMPIVFDLIDSLMPLVDVLLAIIGPILGIIGELFKIFAPLFMDLVNLLMPPLLKILGTVAWIMGKLIGTIGDMIKALGELPLVSDKLIDVGEGMMNIGTKFEGIGKTLADAAENYGKSEVDLNEKELQSNADKVDRETLSELKVVSDNTDPESTTVTKELYPAIIEATSSGFVKTENAREVITGSPEKVQEEISREALAEQKRANDLLEELNATSGATAVSTRDTAAATGKSATNLNLIPITGR